MAVQMKLMQLKDLILTMSESEIAELAISDVCDGDIVYSILLEYLLRYTYVYGDSETAKKHYFIFFKYQQWLKYRYPDIMKAMDAVYTEFDPTSDYRLRETEIKLKNDGDTTTTTKNMYDYTTTEGATEGNSPTFTNYTTTYDSTADRLESKRVDTGSTTTRVLASNDELNKKTATVTHNTTTMTQGDTTYSADYIHSINMTKEGNVHSSPADNIKKTIELYKRSLLHEYISEFINTYTFYTGGECL